MDDNFEYDDIYHEEGEMHERFSEDSYVEFSEGKLPNPEWTRLTHGNPTFVEEYDYLPKGYYLRMDNSKGRYNMILDENDHYEYYYAKQISSGKTPDEIISRDVYVEIIGRLCSEMHFEMIVNCQTFILPFNIGSIHVEEIPSKRGVDRRKWYKEKPDGSGEGYMSVQRSEVEGKYFTVGITQHHLLPTHLSMYYFTPSAKNLYQPYVGKEGITKYSLEVANTPGKAAYTCNRCKRPGSTRRVVVKNKYDGREERRQEIIKRAQKIRDL